jgi:hypothetical protein
MKLRAYVRYNGLDEVLYYFHDSAKKGQVSRIRRTQLSQFQVTWPRITTITFLILLYPYYHPHIFIHPAETCIAFKYRKKRHQFEVGSNVFTRRRVDSSGALTWSWKLHYNNRFVRTYVLTTPLETKGKQSVDTRWEFLTKNVLERHPARTRNSKSKQAYCRGFQNQRHIQPWSSNNRQQDYK